MKNKIIARILANKEIQGGPALGYKTLIELEKRNLLNNK